jgi:hypothetical protein
LVDGRAEGTTPWKTRPLSPEAHAIEVQAHGFPSQQRSVTVVADKDLLVTFHFGKRTATATRGGRPTEVEASGADEAPTSPTPAPEATPARPAPSEAKAPEPVVVAEAKPTPPPAPVVAAPQPSEAKEQTYDGPISSCPEGATLAGAAPPAGTALYCQLASGAKHGKYLRWFGNGQRAEAGEYMNGKKNGRWVEFYEDGSEREKTQWRRGVKTW